MKAEVYDTVNFPAYAVNSFVYGNALDNEEDNYNLINWEVAIKMRITRSFYRFISIEFGEEEFFSKQPVFGLPCNCVEATIYVEKM